MKYAQVQANLFHLLSGQRILGWRCIEMALREEGPNGAPQFADPTIEYLQFSVLWVDVDGRGTSAFGTYQDSDRFGLRFSYLAEDSTSDMTNIFRQRNVSELPIGEIKKVDVHQDRVGNVQTVSLRFQETIVEIASGEIYEQADGSLRVQLGDDESILVRLSPLNSFSRQ